MQAVIRAQALIPKQYFPPNPVGGMVGVLVKLIRRKA
jgi:hypothetical protein